MSNDKKSEIMGEDQAECPECPDCSEEEGLIDRVLGKVISRKFTVFLTATGLMVWSTLDAETWGMIAIVYIGGQSVIDAAMAIKHGTGRK